MVQLGVGINIKINRVSHNNLGAKYIMQPGISVMKMRKKYTVWPLRHGLDLLKLESP